MSVASINNAVSKISKGADLREEMQLTLGPNANWEDFLVPAPICICLLGELICISNTKDFSLEDKPPKDGFKLMKWPNSFRASLTQVANTGWDAFKAAHSNMDQIRLLTANVPGNLKQAVQILLTGTNEELEDMVPIPLKAIQHTADRCLSLAENVEAKYIFLMDLTAELLEASVSARGEYENKSKETEIALQVAQEHKKIAKEQKEMAKKGYSDLEKSVKKAEESYYQAMDSVPTGWEIIGMNTVEALTNSFTSALDGCVNMYTFGGSSRAREQQLSKGQDGKTNGKTTNEAQPSTPVVDKGTIDAYNQAIRMKVQTDLLAAYCVENDTLKKPLGPSLNKVIYVEKQLGYILKAIKALSGGSQSSDVKDRALKLCNTGLSVCAELTKLAKAFQDENEEEAKKYAGKILLLRDDVMCFATEGTTIIGSSPTSPPAPHQKNVSTGGSETTSASQQAVQTARFKVEQSSAYLEFTREKHSKACDQMMDTSKQLGNILADIAKLDIKTIDFEKIRQTLIKGIKAIGQLREEWAKMVMFFTMMSNIIRCSLNTSLKGFLQYTTVTEQHSLKGYPITSLKRDMIYQQAFESAKIAYFVNMISGTYVQVSKDYLMDPMAGLGKLLGYDPETQISAIERERAQLNQGMQAAQAGILELVKKRKSEFDGQIAARINKIRKELEQALPEDSSSTKTKERIQSAVQKGIENVKESKSDIQTSALDPDDFI